MKKDTLFTADTRLYSVKHCEEFRPFRKYILAPRQISSLMTLYKIKQLNMFYHINPDETAHALNVMKEGVRDGRISYRPLQHKDAGLYSFITGKDRSFVLVLAGGAYGDVCSIIEAFPVAVKLNEMGYNAYAGQYRVGKEALFPNPADDVAEMISIIMNEGPGMGVRTEDYAVCGFSAGGHLAALWGTESLGWTKYGLPKPGAVWLGYPVITMGEFTHTGTRDHIAGKNASKERLDMLSAEKLVTPDYPKTYIWQCVRDSEVPFRNSELMAAALEECGCEYELLPVDYDRHGIGLGTGTPAEGWIDRAVQFWQKDGQENT